MTARKWDLIEFITGEEFVSQVRARFVGFSPGIMPTHSTSRDAE
jgi:hypothetical protein